MPEEVPRLEERLARLDAIVVRLEREDVELEDALELFEEGITHLRAAEKLLRDSELRIERLLEEASGEVVVEPMPRAGEAETP